MWHWQRSEPHKKYLTKISLCVTLLHGALLFIGFFLFKDAAPQLINLNAISGTVLFLPFHKSVQQARAIVAGASQSNSGLKVIRSGSATMPTTPAVVQKSAPSAAKTSLVEDRNDRLSARQKRKRERIQKQKALAAAQKKKEAAQKKKQALADKKAMEKKEAVPAEPVKAEVASAVSPVQPQLSSASAAEAGEVIIPVGQLDLDVLELQEAIRTEVVHHWRPPTGVPAGKVCIVRVMINWQGKAEELVVEESSKVLMFDMSVRQALRSMEFPKSAWGKELIVPFRS